MKQTNLSQFILLISTVFFTTNTVFANSATNQNKNAAVTYDKTNNLISVNVKATSLKQVLKKIAQQSRLEVLFDDAAEEKISITLNALPLAKAIENILRGKNHLLQYTNTDNQGSILTSVIVLPNGQSDTSNAKRLNNLDREALYHASKNLTIKQSNKINHILERWNARLSRVPLEKRHSIEERARIRVLKHEKEKQRRNKRRAEVKAQEEKRSQYMASKQAERYQHLTEDEITQEQLREQEIRDNMRTQLLQQLNQNSTQ